MLRGAGATARRRPLASARPTPVSRPALRAALREDRTDRDRTTRTVLPGPIPGKAEIVAQGSGVLSGIRPAVELARLARLRPRPLLADGARIRRGSRVLELQGDLRRILGVERTILNYLMHLSGVATATHRAVRSAGRGTRVYGTRKTLPGLRDLEKDAVRHGGGEPHRRDLASGLLVKNTHLALVPVEDAVARARRRGGGSPIQVEVRSAAEAVRAARAGADALLIDNQGPRRSRAILRALEHAGLRQNRWVELSGGITPENARHYRSVGADALSLGSITHSARAVPFHLVVRRRRVTSRRAPT